MKKQRDTQQPPFAEEFTSPDTSIDNLRKSDQQRLNKGKSRKVVNDDQNSQ